MMKTIIASRTEKYNKLSPQGYWSGSVFEDARVRFPQDYKGKYGEDIVFELIKDYTDIPVEWDEDKNTNNDDGVYDLFWYLHNGKKMRVEVKTSGRTISKGRLCGWQHDNVYFTDNKWDKLIFYDYDANPDVVYLTIVDYDQVVKDNTIDLSLFGKNGHVRKNEEGKAKVDFSLNVSIKSGIDNNVTLKYDVNNPDNEELINFLNEKLG